MYLEEIRRMGPFSLKIRDIAVDDKVLYLIGTNRKFKQSIYIVDKETENVVREQVLDGATMDGLSTFEGKLFVKFASYILVVEQNGKDTWRIDLDSPRS